MTALDRWSEDDDIEFYETCQRSEFDKMAERLAEVVPPPERRLNVVQSLAIFLFVEVCIVVAAITWGMVA